MLLTIDALRLVSLIYEYGEIEEVSEKFLEDSKCIDSRAWIEVVPQIIARISTQKKSVQKLFKELLIHISSSHP